MQITVNGQHIAIVDDTLVSNSVNIYECEFEFDASWDGFAKTSVWQLNSDNPIEVVIDSGVAVIPHEVLENAGILRIGVYGTKDEKVMPTVWLEKRKVCLGTPTGSIGTEPTPSIYAQILAVATEAKDIAEEVQTEWESVTAEAETLPSGSDATVSFSDGVFNFGIPKGEQGEQGEQGAKGDKGDTGAKGDKGDKGDTGEVSEAELEEALIDKADVILNSASGSIVTFDDGANMPVKSLEVEINAVQSGSGDPSPTNVRPISGFSEVDVVVSPTLDAGDGTTYPISLGSTYYGGVLDVTSGVLTVDKAIVDLGTLNYSVRGNVGMQSNGLSSVIKNPSDNYTLPNVVCSIAKENTWQQLVNGGTNSGYIGVSGGYICIATSETDTAAFKTAMAGQKLVYPLATPQTITLTPTEVSTVLGTNNLWADCGDVAVIYRADTKAYIDGTIVDVPLAMIAPIEKGTKASKAYAIGEYFILNGNQFCKAKTAIASGATFTLNTNYTVTTIGAELKALA